MLDKAGVKSTFVDGLRVTDEATMEVAEMVLSGAINKEIANWITLRGRRGRRARRGPVGQGRPADHRREGARAPARTRTATIEQAVDLGFVGEPTKVDPHI